MRVLVLLIAAAALAGSNKRFSGSWFMAAVVVMATGAYWVARF